MVATTTEQLTALAATTVIIHPLVLLSVTDHHARSVSRGSHKRVIGVLLGQDNGKTINVANSFGIPFEEDEKDSKTWFLDHNYIEGMYEMFKKVTARERMIGWYHTGPKLRASDQEITELFKTEAKLKEVEELADPEHPRVFHVTRCSSCQGQLDLPSVHFMCNHSYHQRCLAENETECPNCAREHGVIREIRKNNERLADQHDVFVSEVQEGGFEAVAAAFGRGILNMTRPLDMSA